MCGTSCDTNTHTHTESAHLNSMSCSILTAMTTRGFRPLFMEKMVRLEDRRSVVFSVSAAVPAPQQLRERERERERERGQREGQKEDREEIES